jgi:type IV pilus assembly protein PilY1
MNSTLQLSVSALCLGALLAAFGQARAQSTNVAQLPMNATVLAKPNVIFAQDDSGSMDWEFLIPSNDGIPMWDYRNGRGLLNNDILRSGGSGHWGYYYLFPNGTGTGRRLYGDPDSSYGYGMPPTPQLAWTRNKDYNPIYYNPATTYQPWAPAYVNGGLMTFANANPAAAKSHPVLGADTYRLNANLFNTDPEWRFTFMAGMTIPAGATVHSCLNGPMPGALPYTVTTGNLSCMASMSFYPATYWVADNSCSVDGVTCVMAPDNVRRLKRYEIKAGVTFPSGRSHTDELQNFANWFTYYRKRRTMLAGSMGEVLENLSGLRLGVVDFNNRRPVTMYDADHALPAANRLRVAGAFYTNERMAGTPTRETLAYIGEQYRRTDNDTQGNKIIQYACQRNNAFVVTDGFANPSSVSVPSYNRSTYVGAAPYSTIFDSSLADVASAYYTLNLRPDLTAGKVPLEDASKLNADRNPNLHMNTFGLTMGLSGFQWPATTNAQAFATPPTWANPNSQTRVQIDDLWHATINGRGKKYLATSPEETATQVQAGLTEILNFAGSQSSASVSEVNLVRGDGFVYLAGYNPAGWSGDLEARTVASDTGLVNAAVSWSASSILSARDWSNRVIATSNGSNGVSFNEANAAALVNPANAYGSAADVMNYLRGDRSKEGTLFRTRTSLMGAVINAQPTLDDGVAYVASGEGMLHAFDTKAPNQGKELWAFVPRTALSGMGQISQRGYSFRTRLDGTPVVASLSSTQKLLVAGMGAAGRSYYALDVSNPRGLTETQLAGNFKWEFPASGDTVTRAKVGLAMARPVITKTAADGNVVLVTSGYNSTADGKGRLWMLNANTGAVITEFTVNAGTLAAESGLTQVSAFLESDGTVRYVYGGDLLGNLWRFDLVAKNAPVKMATLVGPGGDAQPVTAAPELLLLKDKRIVIVGTGRLLDITDFGGSKVQSIYAIADTAGGSTLVNARSSLMQVVRSSGDTITSSAVNWATQRGWFFDLPAGEQINTRPLAVYGVVGFIGNQNGASDCSASSYFYWLSVNGTQTPGVTGVRSELSPSANSSGLVAVLTSTGKVRFYPTSNDRQIKATTPLPPPTILPGKNAWREVRR